MSSKRLGHISNIFVRLTVVVLHQFFLLVSWEEDECKSVHRGLHIPASSGHRLMDCGELAKDSVPTQCQSQCLLYRIDDVVKPFVQLRCLGLSTVREPIAKTIPVSSQMFPISSEASRITVRISLARALMLFLTDLSPIYLANSEFTTRISRAGFR